MSEPDHMTEERSQAPPSAWSLITAGDYRRAIDHLTQEYAAHGGLPSLRNRMTAYLLVGEYQLALADSQHVIASQEPATVWDGDYIRLGICHWYLDQPGPAVDAWERCLTQPHLDGNGYGPAILLYAAERLGDPALGKRAVSTLRWIARRRRWPGPVVLFLLGKSTSQGLEQARQSTNATLHGRWQCQADFYIAVQAWRDGDHATFRQRLTACAANRYGLLEREHYLARWEVQRGFPIPAFPPSNQGAE